MATQVRDLKVAKFGEYKFGQNPLVAQSQESVWSGGGLFPWGTTWDLGPAEIFIQSDDPADDAAGTGCQTITVIGLGGDSLPKSTLVTMSGTFSVSSGTWSMIFRMSCDDVGDQDTNVGEISAVYAATEVAHVIAAEGQTEMAIYTVDATLKGYITRIWADTKTGDNADIGLYTRAAVGKAWRLRTAFNIIGGQAEQIIVPPGLMNVDALTMIDLRATGSNASGAVVDGGFDLVLSTEKV